MNFVTRSVALVVVFAVTGCGLSGPAPYQTYSPGTAPAPAPSRPLIVYGTNTTTPDNQYDFGQQQDQAAAAALTFATPPAAPAQTPDQRIALCYSKWWSSAEAVRTAAPQACGGKGNPHVVNQGIDLDACPLLTPTQAVFS